MGRKRCLRIKHLNINFFHLDELMNYVERLGALNVRGDAVKASLIASFENASGGGDLEAAVAALEQNMTEAEELAAAAAAQYPTPPVEPPAP